MYTQFLFAFDRVKKLAPQHPEWKTKQPFKAVLEGDMKTVSASGMKGLMEILIETHTGMTATEFEQDASNWLAATKHPKFKRPYTECVYQPQLELMAYLRTKGFKTFIVSGGGIQFMRPMTEETYGIPPEQVVGSSVVSEFQVKDGKPVLVRMPKIDFVNDKAGKPVGIYEHIGRRPILAFGNSDSDMQMIEYTMAGEGRRWGSSFTTPMRIASMPTTARATLELSTRFLIWPKLEGLDHRGYEEGLEGSVSRKLKLPTPVSINATTGSWILKRNSMRCTTSE